MLCGADKIQGQDSNQWPLRPIVVGHLAQHIHSKQGNGTHVSIHHADLHPPVPFGQRLSTQRHDRHEHRDSDVNAVGCNR